MAGSPAFQFYPDDFMGGKPGLMTPEETHVYVWLLCLDWNHGPFAFDETTLARWCRVPPRVVRRAWPAVRACFTETDGLYHNERLEKERAKQAEWRAKSSAGGKKSADIRGKGGSTTLVRVVEECLQPEGNTPVSVTNSVTTKKPKARRGTAAPWMGEIRALWAEVYPESSGPAKGIAGTLHEVVEKHGIERVVSELRSYLGSISNPQMLNIPKWASTFGGSQRSGALSYAEKLIGFFVKHGFTTGVPIEDHDARIDQLAGEGTVKDPDRLKREMRAVRPWMTLKGLRAGEEAKAAERVDKLLREVPSEVAA